MSGWEPETLGEPDRGSDQTPWPNDMYGYVSSLNEDIKRYRNEAKFRRIIGIAIARYFIKGERVDWVAMPYEKVRGDSKPEWIPGLLARRELSEPEFSIFRYLARDTGSILDIGANFGYAAASIWAAGSTAPILSFEPNPGHLPCLRHIKELRPGQYDFVNLGLGSRLSDAKFVIPVAEGVALSALASASIESGTDYAVPDGILHYLMDHHPDLEEPRVHFTEVVWRTERLDDVLRDRRFDIDLSQISAMKVDVEGLEADVLIGAEQTLRTHKPLIMVEGANRLPEVVGLLSSLNYRFAEFVSDALVLSDRQSSQNNGFFVHEEKIVGYRDQGLLRA